MVDKKLIMEKVIPNLQKNKMKAYFVEKKEDVLGLIKELTNEGETASNGGSETLKQCGVIEYLKSGKFNYLDRSIPNLTPDEIRDVYVKTFGADVYFSSANAITQTGELYNVDGNSNRIAAIAFGPKSVIIVAGYNKIVENLDQAVLRVKDNVAAVNCQRLNCETYCKEKGKCVSLNLENPSIAQGCSSDARICCNYLISAQQRHVDRIKVIIVGEKLGY